MKNRLMLYSTPMSPTQTIFERSVRMHEDKLTVISGIPILHADELKIICEETEKHFIDKQGQGK